MPVYIVWKDEYSVGRADMDRQHKAILNLINRLYSARMDDSTTNMIGPTLEGLLQFAVTHFAQEERLLKQGRCPDLEKHAASHAEMATTVRKMTQRFYASKEDITLDLLTFLRQWWTAHIVGMDQQCKPYLPPQTNARTKDDLV